MDTKKIFWKKYAEIEMKLKELEGRVLLANEEKHMKIL